MKNFITALKGAALGTAFVIPGFSGGTMAVILKIYDRLLDAISLNIEKLKKNFGFILFLVIGMAAGVFATAVGLSWLFENHPVPTALTLTGIVVGSLPMIWKEGTSESKFKPLNIIPFLIASWCEPENAVKTKSPTYGCLSCILNFVQSLYTSAISFIFNIEQSSALVVLLIGVQTLFFISNTNSCLNIALAPF